MWCNTINWHWDQPSCFGGQLYLQLVIGKNLKDNFKNEVCIDDVDFENSELKVPFCEM